MTVNTPHVLRIFSRKPDLQTFFRSAETVLERQAKKHPKTKKKLFLKAVNWGEKTAWKKSGKSRNYKCLPAESYRGLKRLPQEGHRQKAGICIRIKNKPKTTTLKAALDVYYKADKAKAVCVLFDDWTSASLHSVYAVETAPPADYEAGQFYKRELPPLLDVLKTVNLAEIETLIVDGYVYLNDEGRPGLGARLYSALTQPIPVIGVAKRKFGNSQNVAVAVKRGGSLRPLFVTAIGMEAVRAASLVQNMAGAYRMPTLLKQLDGLTRH